MCADNGIDWTGVSAMRAADTQGLVDNRNGGCDRLCERYDVPAEQIGQPANGLFTTWRAKIDCGFTINNGCCEWPAPRIAALSTLGLWQKVIDLLHEFVGTWW
jgi:hypothetical protein